MSETLLANDAATRTETGEIKDQTPLTPETPTTTEEKPSLLNEAAPKEAPKEPGKAPEKYDFKFPEGLEMDEATTKEVDELFRGLDLGNEAGQKLIDFYQKKVTEMSEAPYKLWADTQAKWIDEIKSDASLGGRLPEVKATVARAIDGLGDPKLAADFRAAMDYTGAGNNPAFIRAFYKLAQQVTEGRHIAGRGPSDQGQKPTPVAPASAGRALYPNLP
jgi:hypothetical protein